MRIEYNERTEALIMSFIDKIAKRKSPPKVRAEGSINVRKEYDESIITNNNLEEKGIKINATLSTCVKELEDVFGLGDDTDGQDKEDC